MPHVPRGHHEDHVLGDVRRVIADALEVAGHQDEIERRLDGRRILQHVGQQLPEDLRTAIVLRELEGLSYEEIAEAMDCPVGTVRSRIFRAREAIDKKLKPLLD